MKTTELSMVFPFLRAAGLRPMIWGAPGGGKSSSVKNWASKGNLPLVVLELSRVAIEDIGGGLIPDLENRSFITRAPDWVNQFENGFGVLFLDELTTARPSILDAAINLILDGRVNSNCVLPDGVFIIAAGNPPENTHSGSELSDAMNNRVVHIRVEDPRPREILDLMKNDWEIDYFEVDPPSKEDMVKEFGAIVEFLEADGREFWREKPRAGAYGTPRSWNAVARFLAVARGKLDDDFLYEIVEGIVGEAAALGLQKWFEQHRLPSPEQLIAGAPLPADAGGCIQVLGDLLEHLKVTGDPECWRIFCRLLDENRAELGINLAAEFIGEMARKGHIPDRLDEWVEFIL